MIEANVLERDREVVSPLAERLELSRRLAEYRPFLWTGREPSWPVLHLEDVSGIPFVGLVPGVEEYQHRARVRAETGDLFAAVTPQAPAYESYCRERLGLGEPEFVLAAAGGNALAVAEACARPPAVERIVQRAMHAGGLRIHPYMAIEPVWALARRISAGAGVPVRVIGPPPPVLWLANDKSLLSEVVARVLSEDWLVETHSAREPAEMAHHLLILARRHRKVGLKRTRCASAMGNAVYDLERIEQMGSERIIDEVRAFLERTEWALNEEVLVVAWEETDDSPSTQLWIPPVDTGPPVVEGIYEQLLEGEEKIFLGSRPSLLPPEVNRELARASLRVGAALQSLGYVGRCSFDFLLLPDVAGGFRLKFTECNGRWGGTSTPMHLVDRLFEGRRPAYRAQDFMHHDLTRVGFDEVLRRVGDEVYDPRSGRGRYVFYNVGPLALCGKLDVIAVAPTAAEAERSLHEDLPRRLGVAGG